MIQVILKKFKSKGEKKEKENKIHCGKDICAQQIQHASK